MTPNDLEPSKEYYITFYGNNEDIIMQYNGIYEFIQNDIYNRNIIVCTFKNEKLQSLMLDYNIDKSTFSKYCYKTQSGCFCDISELTNEYVLK